ncbi:MAG: hypothetical protein IJU50_04470, partial [Lachnospiraceae bacterium]|nr:hypothetical protein [Lachnospiraceae bacterium]
AGKHGKAVVTCHYDPYETGTGFTYRTTVYVEDVTLETGGGLAEKKAGSSYTLSLNNGEKFVLKTAGNFQPIIFESGKPALAFVDEAGVVYARGKGKATLSARVNGKKISVAVTVN